MNEKIKDGGPCFPQLAKAGTVAVSKGGLTVRDWFAGQAMRAILETDEYQIAEGRRILAINCYALADAFIAEREKGGGS